MAKSAIVAIDTIWNHAAKPSGQQLNTAKKRP
jgi:hypothetical protein